MINKVQVIFVTLVSWLLSSPLAAEVTRFEITAREPFASGQAFGEVGAYERIVGRVHFELDPDLPQNQNVIDLKLAPRNERADTLSFPPIYSSCHLLT